MDSHLERYVNGEMSHEETIDFEKKLASDPELRNAVAEERAFLERLKTQMIREKVVAAIGKTGTEAPPAKRKFRGWIWGLSVLLLLFFTGALLWLNQQDEDPPLMPHKTPEQSIPPADNHGTDPNKNERRDLPSAMPQGSPPIAENQKVNPPDRTSGLRGEGDENNDWEALVSSVWVTRSGFQTGEFNERFIPVVELLRREKLADAFVQLYMLERESPTNDTLAYLKGYCLLEMREGAASMSYFDRLPVDNPWRQEVAWYKVLAYLTLANREAATDAAREVIAEKDHPYFEPANQVIIQLDQN